MPPFKSEKQRRFMYAAANTPGAEKKYGIKRGAAKRFVEHSTGKRYGKKG